MRGEKVKVSAIMDTMPGSPPHARGKAQPFQGSRDYAGITPACAGKSPPVSTKPYIS